MKLKTLILSAAVSAAAILLIPSEVQAWGASHSSSTSWGGGGWNHSGSTTWNGRYGNSYTTSHSGSGSYYGGYHSGSGSFHGAYGNTYHYSGGGYHGVYGGGFHAGYVSGPYGGHAGFVRRW